jgi:hypothetical protein
MLEILVVVGVLLMLGGAVAHFIQKKKGGPQ